MERLGTAVLRSRMAGGVGGAGSNPVPTRFAFGEFRDDVCLFEHVRGIGRRPIQFLNLSYS